MCEPGRVLIVDDEPLMLQALSRLLKRAELAISTASSGQEALRILAGTNDVVVLITDVNMPSMDGVTLFSEVRRRELYFGPVVFLTGNVDQQRLRLESQGASAVMEKPIDYLRLLSVIQELARANRRLIEQCPERLLDCCCG